MEKPPGAGESPIDQHVQAAFELQKLLYSELHEHPSGLLDVLRHELEPAVFMKVHARISDLEERVAALTRRAAGITGKQWNEAAFKLGRDIYMVDQRER